MDAASPIEQLAALLLNHATRLNAQAVLFAMCGGGGRLALKYKIAGEWIDQERPPKYLWLNLRNVLLLWGGVEYWRKGATTGIVRRDAVVQAWSMKVSESQDVIEFEPDHVCDQIQFFLCDSMRKAVEDEARRIGAELTASQPADGHDIQFTPDAADGRQGRLRIWAEADDRRSYEDLCRVVRDTAWRDETSGLWVRHDSRAAFEAYSEEKRRKAAECEEFLGGLIVD